MKLDFENYPLNIYSNDDCIRLLNSIESEVPSCKYDNRNLSDAILSSFVKKAAGAGFLALIDSVAIGIRGNQARKCLATLVREQKGRTFSIDSIRKEAQINLMATYCVTNYLSSMESGSWSNGAKNIGKCVVGLFKGQNPLDTIFESTIEICHKYDDISQIYHIAFLLNIYHLNHQTEDLIKDLIVETLCSDNSGESSFAVKKRRILFSNSPYQTLHDNLSNRMSFLIDNTHNVDGLYNPFIRDYEK